MMMMQILSFSTLLLVCYVVESLDDGEGAYYVSVNIDFERKDFARTDERLVSFNLDWVSRIRFIAIYRESTFFIFIFGLKNWECIRISTQHQYTVCRVNSFYVFFIQSLSLSLSLSIHQHKHVHSIRTMRKYRFGSI